MSQIHSKCAIINHQMVKLWRFCYFRVNSQQWILENELENSEKLSVPKTDNFTSSLNWTETPAPQTKFKSLLTEIVSLHDYALPIYSCLLGVTIVITVSRSLGFFKYCMVASTKLHNGMFNKIVLSPMFFFNNNPSGRILNRFSKDIGNVDEMLPITMIDTVQVRFSPKKLLWFLREFF